MLALLVLSCIVTLPMTERSNSLKYFVRVCEDRWAGSVGIDFQKVPLSCLVNATAINDCRGPFEKVQSSDTAEVYRYSIEIQGKRELLYLKKYPARSLIDAVQHLFRPSRAKRAFNAGLMLEKHGLHTPQIVAFLQKKEGFFSEDILITQEMENAASLSAVLGSNEKNLGPMRVKDKRRMVTKLGTAIGTLHKAGISHGDLRGGNVFVTQDSDKWRFIFIDNERTVKYSTLSFRLRIKNLVQLNMQKTNVSMTDRMRFLRAYRQAAGISYGRSKQIARTVAQKTLGRFKQRAKTRTGLSNGGEQVHWNFQMAHAGNRGGTFLTDFVKADTATRLLNQIEDLMEAETVLKNDVSTRVVRCVYDGWDIVIKRYNNQGLWHALRHTIKGSRAKKCWRFGHLLTAAGIPCAAPIGVIEERHLGVIRQSYIINAFVAGPLLYVPMNDPNCSPEQRQAIIQKTERLLEKLGEHKLTHSDMKSSNMIISDGGPVLIDLDSMQQHRHKNPYFKNRYKKMLNTFHRRLDGKK